MQTPHLLFVIPEGNPLLSLQPERASKPFFFRPMVPLQDIIARLHSRAFWANGEPAQ
jgi:hypothetical protein